MATDVHNYVANCEARHKRRPSYIHQRWMQSLSPSGHRRLRLFMSLGPLQVECKPTDLFS